MRTISDEALTILCIEDDSDARTIIELSLRLDPAIAVQSAASATETMQLWSTGYRPDLVLMDVRMSEVDGLTLLERLRMADGFPPFIFLTGLARPAEMAGLRAAGPIGILTKPFDPLHLASDVRRLLFDHQMDCSN